MLIQGGIISQRLQGIQSLHNCLLVANCYLGASKRMHRKWHIPKPWLPVAVLLVLSLMLLMASRQPCANNRPQHLSGPGDEGNVKTQLILHGTAQPKDALLALLPQESERWLVNCGCGFSGADMATGVLKEHPNIPGLRSLYIDPKPCWTDHPSIRNIQKALGPKEVVANMQEQGFTSNGWFLKIDIDSFDCEVARAVLAAGFRPRIIVIETMGCFPPPVEFTLLKTAVCMPHEPACVKEFGEKDWPNNCCMYSCSTQEAINVMGQHDYRPMAIHDGDVWFVRGDVEIPGNSLMYNITSENILQAWMKDSAGMRSVFNLHKEHVGSWAELSSTGRLDQLQQRTCEVFRQRCSPRRLNMSDWRLSVAGKSFCQY